MDIAEDAWFMDTAYSPALNAKMRKAIQAKQAWAKHQETDTPTPTPSASDSLLTKHAALAQKKRSTVGGPHDNEFFRCFVTYLDEALIQISEGHPKTCDCGQDHDSILSQCS